MKHNLIANLVDKHRHDHDGYIEQRLYSNKRSVLFVSVTDVVYRNMWTKMYDHRSELSFPRVTLVQLLTEMFS